VFLPIHKPADAMMAALNTGTLVEADGCLWIESGEVRHLVLWPPGSTVRLEPIGLVVENDGARAVIGTQVEAGGGEITEDEYAWVVEQIGRQVPDPCRASGLYWLASGVSSAGR
jgi:hypothetical protein